jgi:hypothetical protein
MFYMYATLDNCGQIHSPWLGDKADSDIGLLYRPVPARQVR